MSLWLKGAAVALIGAGIVSAATSAARADGPAFFTQDFNGGTLGPHLKDDAGAFSFTSGADKKVQNSSGVRNYVRTADTNYNATDFTFRVDFDSAAASGYDGIVFIGLGNGLPSASNGREPDTALGYHLDPADFINDGVTTDPATGKLYPNGAFAVRQNHDQDGNTYLNDLQRATFIGRLPGQGLYTAELKKTGDAVRFSILSALTGQVVVGADGNAITGTRRLSDAAPFLNDTNSGLYFGTTQGGVAFDNFRVTGAVTAPEPQTILLSALGLSLLTLQRFKSGGVFRR